MGSEPIGKPGPERGDAHQIRFSATIGQRPVSVFTRRSLWGDEAPGMMAL
jgi:hypothetical protein